MGNSHLRFSGRIALRGTCSIPRSNWCAWPSTWWVVAGNPQPDSVDCADPGQMLKPQKRMIVATVDEKHVRRFPRKPKSPLNPHVYIGCAVFRRCRSELEVNRELQLARMNMARECLGLLGASDLRVLPFMVRAQLGARTISALAASVIAVRTSGVTRYAPGGFRQCPDLTREAGAVRKVGLVVVGAPVEDIQAHVGAPEHRRQAKGAASVLHEFPGLAREVGAVRKVGLVVVWAPIEDVQAHAGATELRRQAKGAVGVLRESPELARDILIQHQMCQVILRTIIEDVELPLDPAELRAQLVVEVLIDRLGRRLRNVQRDEGQRKYEQGTHSSGVHRMFLLEFRIAGGTCAKQYNRGEAVGKEIILLRMMQSFALQVIAAKNYSSWSG